MSKNIEKIQFNLARKYEDIHKKAVQSLKEKDMDIYEISYEKEVVYSLAKVKELK